MLLTTIAGSLPKPSWLAEPEKLWASWRLAGEALEEGKRDAALLVRVRSRSLDPPAPEAARLAHPFFAGAKASSRVRSGPGPSLRNGWMHTWLAPAS